MCESYIETTTIELGKLGDGCSTPTTPALLKTYLESCNRALRANSEEIIDAAILLFKERFPDDERQPVRKLCYMDDFGGVVLCDTEYKIGAYFVGISDDDDSHVTLEYDFAEVIEGSN